MSLLANFKTQFSVRCSAFSALAVFSWGDSLQNWYMRISHIGDMLVPVDPDTFGARLENAGFEVLEVQKNSEAFRFRARRRHASPVKTRIGE